MILTSTICLNILIALNICIAVSLQLDIGSRVKRYDGQWIWAGNDPTKKNTNNTFQRVRTDPNGNLNDPCAPYDPPKPDFRRPGRRISEQKCLEYIWERKNREEKARKRRECISTKKNETPDGFVSIAEVGGRDALPAEFPHMGALGWRAVTGTWIFKCGSSLISSKFMLTAAHCTKTTALDTNIANTTPEIVRLGDNNIVSGYSYDKGPIDVEILRIYVHPSFSAPKKYFDIALIELVRRLQFSSNIQPACLWNIFDTTRLGSHATSTGWGVTEVSSRETSPILQVVEVDIIDTVLCNNLLTPFCNRLWCGIQDHQICAGKLEGGVDSCQGDSGGPLQMKISLPESNEGSMHFVIGITSFGIGCARPNLPSVYTRVSTFVDWVESVVWPNSQ